VAARGWREGARPEAGQRRAVLVAGARVGVDGPVCGGIKSFRGGGRVATTLFSTLRPPQFVAFQGAIWSTISIPLVLGEIICMVLCIAPHAPVFFCFVSLILIRPKNHSLEHLQ
jgi:hypothetical protein